MYVGACPRTRTYDDATDRSGKINWPTMGNWDGRQHIGEGPWDGGSGGSGTAGIGGRAGSYRLDAGQELVMLSEEEKAALPPEYGRVYHFHKHCHEPFCNAICLRVLWRTCSS